MLGRPARHDARFDERRADAAFAVVGSQHLTTAAAADTRPYETRRGYSQDGPIPAQCRSGSCGTCWIGVLGGADLLSEVDDIERRRLVECGYDDVTTARPFIRLACMARASGNVTFVIPPWNGFLTKGLERLAVPRLTPAAPQAPLHSCGRRAGTAERGSRVDTARQGRRRPPHGPGANPIAFTAPDVESDDGRGRRPSNWWTCGRTPSGRSARIDGARLLDRAYHDHLLTLPPDTALVFQCHHGIRSRAAAEYFREKGFVRLFNLEGGIDAWSALVDPAVPRYWAL